nr:MAG TPA: hypothetical protein [Caudoviricetes sp.]
MGREKMSKENHTYHPRLRAGVTRQHRGVCLHAFASGYVCDKGEGQTSKTYYGRTFPRACPPGGWYKHKSVITDCQ